MTSSKNNMPDNAHLMNDQDLQARLQSYSPAGPSDLLKIRILKMAEQTPQDKGEQDTVLPAKPIAQNDPAPKKVRRFGQMKWAAGLICAFSLGMFALTQIDSGQAEQSDIWQEAALELGVSDIYDWVENEN